jgi:hypothetical protein
MPASSGRSNSWLSTTSQTRSGRRVCSAKLRATDRDEQTVLVMTARLIGYWRSELPETHPRFTGARAPEWTRIREDERQRTLQWPVAAMFVDPTWPEDDRRRVAEYLQRGKRVRQQRGWSDCRFCERPNGSAESLTARIAGPRDSPTTYRSTTSACLRNSSSTPSLSRLATG